MFADTVHRDAMIYTLDPARPWASVMLVADGTIVAVGDEELLTDVDGSPDVISHGGAFLMPGLGDVHTHHMLAGRAQEMELELDATADLPTLLAAIRDWSADLPADEWIVGGGWGSTLASHLSTAAARTALDEACGQRPVLLRSDSCHDRWVSSAALTAAAITEDTPDPDGGALTRDPHTGTLTGLLIEAAGLPVEHAYARAVPFTLEDDARACLRGIETLRSHGITMYQDAAAGLPMLRALRHLDDTGQLKAWAVTSMQINDRIFGTHPLGKDLISHREETRGRHHRPDFVKIFLDGIPPSRTAGMIDPYVPDADHGANWRGETTMTQAELECWLLWLAEQNLGAKIHATGDRSVRMVLDAAAKVRAAGFTHAPIQVAHGQYIAEEDVPRFAELGVIADLSPAMWFPGVLVEAVGCCITPQRADRAHPNRDLYDSGALLAAGSDWPVSPSPNPWPAIQGLVTRQDPTGTFPGTLWPEQALTLEQALAVYTLHVARALGIDDVTGSLTPGKSADFVTLDRNPFTADPNHVAATTATGVWFAGHHVHG